MDNKSPPRGNPHGGGFVCERIIYRFPGSPFGGAGTALAVTERALSAPFGGTSPKGRGKEAFLTPNSAKGRYS